MLAKLSVFLNLTSLYELKCIDKLFALFFNSVIIENIDTKQPPIICNIDCAIRRNPE